VLSPYPFDTFLYMLGVSAEKTHVRGKQLIGLAPPYSLSISSFFVLFHVFYFFLPPSEGPASQVDAATKLTAKQLNKRIKYK
jgi:hypothetical protein